MSMPTTLRLRTLAIVLLACLAMSQPLQLRGEDGARAIAVQAIRAPQPAAFVRVSVDRADRTYQIGDKVVATVKSSCAGHLYLIYVHTDDAPVLLFPNQHQRDNQISADKEYHIPAIDETKFILRATKPTGVGVLKAIVTKSKIKQLDVDQLDKNVLIALTDDDIKAIGVEARGQARILADHEISVGTISDTRSPILAHQRIGIFVGISEYLDPQITDLKVCHTDAEKLAQVMKAKCGLTHVIILTDEEATLKNIEKEILAVARQLRPSDEVLLFWSGHGARIADTSGDEKDGFDEVLVPHDASTANVDAINETMLTDDLFGRWVQHFDGCGVLVILDTCHSGGQANNEKGLSIAGVTPPDDGTFDFWDGEFNTLTKDIGQQATVLCSSRANQISFVRREEDLSVMVYYIVTLIEGSQSRSITVQQLFDHVSEKVPAYVKRVFGVQQTPVLIGDEKPKFAVRR